MAAERFTGTTLEELTIEQQDWVRDHILSDIEDFYQLNQKQPGEHILKQWDLLSRRRPRVIGLKTKDESKVVIVPFADLSQRVIGVFKKDRDINHYMPTQSYEDIAVEDTAGLDNLPADRMALTSILTYRLKPLGDMQRSIRHIIYYSGSGSQMALAERWVLENKVEVNPLDDSQFGPVKAKVPTDINFGEPRGILLPVNSDGVFSRN